MSHEMGIEDNQDTLISEMHKGVKRGESPFCKIWREKRSGRCILLQPLRRDRLKREKRYTIGETETLLTEKTKRRKENILLEKLERESFS